MRKPLLATLVLLPVLLVALLLVMLLGGSRRDYTTSSRRAYELFQQARQEVNAFRYATADSLLKLALFDDPGFAAAHALRSGILRQLGDTGRAAAEAALADSLRARVSDPLERDRIALILLQGRSGSAARVDSLVARILSRDPDDLMALTVRAQRLFARRDPETEAAFHRILEIDPNYAPAYNLLGYLAAARGDYARAIDDLKTYAFLAPDQANPHDSLGEILWWAGRRDEAEREFLTALRIQPDFTWSRIHLGALYMDRGQVRRGERILFDLHRLIAGTPLDLELGQTMLRIYYNQLLYDRARAVTDTLVRRHPDRRRLTYFLAIAEAATGDTTRARETFRALSRKLSEGGEQKQGYLTMMRQQLDAVLAERRGDPATARAAWGALLSCSPHLAPHESWAIRWRLGNAELDCGDPAAALALADTILAYDPARMQALLLHARAALALNDTATARADLSRLRPLVAEADDDLPLVADFRALSARMAKAPPGTREAPSGGGS